MTTVLNNRRHKARAFNLIEAAIVLGVVGLVIGGIWVAASAVRTELQATRLTETILTFNEKLQGYITRDVVGAGTWGYGDYVSISQTIGSSINGLSWNAGAGLMKSDFGDVIYSAQTVATAAGNQPMISMEIYGLSRAVCARVVERLRVVVQQQPLLLPAVIVNNPSTGQITTPSFYGGAGNNDTAPCANASNSLALYFISQR